MKERDEEFNVIIITTFLTLNCVTSNFLSNCGFTIAIGEIESMTKCGI